MCISNLGYDQILLLIQIKLAIRNIIKTINLIKYSYDEVDHFEDLKQKIKKKIDNKTVENCSEQKSIFQNNPKIQASRLVDIMSEYQSVVEKKKKIELALDIALKSDMNNLLVNINLNKENTL